MPFQEIYFLLTVLSRHVWSTRRRRAKEPIRERSPRLSRLPRLRTDR